MSGNPIAIVIVPGACGPAQLYDPIISRVQKLGFAPGTVKAIPLRSVGRPAPEVLATQAPATMYDDANFIHSEVEKLADDGYDILLVAHSYGGVVATESMKGLSREAREKQGKTGGVARLFYTTAVAPKIGGTLGEMLMSKEPLSFLVVEGAYVYNEPEGSAAANFSDLPHEEGVEWAKKLDWHSVVTFTNPLTYPGYNDVPVSYLICETDQIIPLATQETCIANIEESSGNKVDVIRINAGHIPYASQMDKMAEIIAEVALKVKA
ncbi:alpha/beta-hydrolase [Thozetella sp. PMI_491]|nr:alpha/beta-hydrolase [Thozetella sp. PMI_491]